MSTLYYQLLFVVNGNYCPDRAYVLATVHVYLDWVCCHFICFSDGNLPSWVWPFVYWQRGVAYYVAVLQYVLSLVNSYLPVDDLTNWRDPGYHT